jgi:hypothetical protein
MSRYIIICEGQSEHAYLQRLQSFLDSKDENWTQPLQFTPICESTSNGYYDTVVATYRRQSRDNKKTYIKIWVDADIYVRQDSTPERKNRAKYLKKPTGIPDFLFSFHNFEDFLALHLDDTAIQSWHTAFDSTHAAKPLHSHDYLPLYKSVFPGYHKGIIAPDFITRESLLRLKINLDRPLISPPPEPSFRSFAQFLITAIDTEFPALLS